MRRTSLFSISSLLLASVLFTNATGCGAAHPQNTVAETASPAVTPAASDGATSRVVAQIEDPAAARLAVQMPVELRAVRMPINGATLNSLMVLDGDGRTSMTSMWLATTPFPASADDAADDRQTYFLYEESAFASWPSDFTVDVDGLATVANWLVYGGGIDVAVSASAGERGKGRPDPKPPSPPHVDPPKPPDVVKPPPDVGKPPVTTPPPEGAKPPEVAKPPPGTATPPPVAKPGEGAKPPPEVAKPPEAKRTPPPETDPSVPPRSVNDAVGRVLDGVEGRKAADYTGEKGEGLPADAKPLSEAELAKLKANAELQHQVLGAEMEPIFTQLDVKGVLLQTLKPLLDALLNPKLTSTSKVPIDVLNAAKSAETAFKISAKDVADLIRRAADTSPDKAADAAAAQKSLAALRADLLKGIDQVQLKAAKPAVEKPDGNVMTALDRAVSVEELLRRIDELERIAKDGKELSAAEKRELARKQADFPLEAKALAELIAKAGKTPVEKSWFAKIWGEKYDAFDRAHTLTDLGVLAICVVFLGLVYLFPGIPAFLGTWGMGLGAAAEIGTVLFMLKRMWTRHVNAVYLNVHETTAPGAIGRSLMELMTRKPGAALEDAFRQVGGADAPAPAKTPPPETIPEAREPPPSDGLDAMFHDTTGRDLVDDLSVGSTFLYW